MARTLIQTNLQKKMVPMFFFFRTDSSEFKQGLLKKSKFTFENKFIFMISDCNNAIPFHSSIILRQDVTFYDVSSLLCTSTLL